MMTPAFSSPSTSRVAVGAATPAQSASWQSGDRRLVVQRVQQVVLGER